MHKKSLEAAATLEQCGDDMMSSSDAEDLDDEPERKRSQKTVTTSRNQTDDRTFSSMNAF